MYLKLHLAKGSQRPVPLVLEDRRERRSLVENVAGVVRTVGSLRNQNDIIALFPQRRLAAGGH